MCHTAFSEDCGRDVERKAGASSRSSHPYTNKSWGRLQLDEVCSEARGKCSFTCMAYDAFYGHCLFWRLWAVLAAISTIDRVVHSLGVRLRSL